MTKPSFLNSREHRTSRNIVKVGAILGAVALAKVGRAGAGRPCIPGPPSCFKGHKLRTAEGDRKVQYFSIGDLLQTEFSGVRPIHGSHAFQSRRAILRGLGRRRHRRFQLPAGRSRPMSRKPTS